MNCLEKMYKEIETILEKEKQEQARLQTPIREIKHAFSEFEKKETNSVTKTGYLSKAVYNDAEYEKKYLSAEQVPAFIEYVFKKFICFHDVSVPDAFFADIKEKCASSDDATSFLSDKEDEFCSLFYDDDAESFFTDPYNALYKDENGYYAVIRNGKFSNVKRPFGFMKNQIKKALKESLSAYSEDFSSRFKTEKERLAFINAANAFINKLQDQDPLAAEKETENYIFDYLKNKGVTEKLFSEYLETKGLRLEKQGNYYFRTKELNRYKNYKKIEFRY